MCGQRRKTALLFFLALADVVGKNKCAVCAVGFSVGIFNGSSDFF
tara:strand:+ start:4784 stop:4918 length:135 start_codon:yes stop_codon:yes gene_type:complete